MKILMVVSIGLLALVIMSALIATYVAIFDTSPTKDMDSRGGHDF